MRIPLLAFGLSLAICLGGCSDDNDRWETVDGKSPELNLESTLMAASTGSSFTIKGTVADADGIADITLRCPGLYLDKTIDIIAIYGEPLKTYNLEYTVPVDAKEAGDLFEIEITVHDVAGQSVTRTVTVDLNGDTEAPVFAVAPPAQALVVLTDKAIFQLGFTVKDNGALTSVKVDIPEIDWHDEVTAFDPEGECVYARDIELPAATAEYTMTVTATDSWNNSVTATSAVTVSDTPDYPRLWLADVKTAAELNSDVMGVPMLIDRTEAYKYEARYYNEKAGTEIFFLPQRNDFNPVRFGIDPDDVTRLCDDPAKSRPFVLDQAGVYYRFSLDLLTKSYTLDTYTVAEAVDPVPHEFGSMTMDFHQDGSEFVEFWFGYTTDGPTAVSRFVQDPANPPPLLARRAYPAQGRTPLGFHHPQLSL